MPANAKCGSLPKKREAMKRVIMDVTTAVRMTGNILNFIGVMLILVRYYFLKIIAEAYYDIVKTVPESYKKLQRERTCYLPLFFSVGMP